MGKGPVAPGGSGQANPYIGEELIGELVFLMEWLTRNR